MRPRLSVLKKTDSVQRCVRSRRTQTANDRIDFECKRRGHRDSCRINDTRADERRYRALFTRAECDRWKMGWEEYVHDLGSSLVGRSIDRFACTSPGHRNEKRKARLANRCRKHRRRTTKRESEPCSRCRNVFTNFPLVAR